MSASHESRSAARGGRKRSLAIHEPRPVVDPGLAVLFEERFARAFDAGAQSPPTGLRERLQQRAQASRAAEAPMVTVRTRRAPGRQATEGVVEHVLYRADSVATLRPGEPLCARLFDLAPGAVLRPEMLGDEAQLRARHREWLVVSGTVRAGAQRLGERDYHVVPAALPTPVWQAQGKARLFLRESPALPAASGAAQAATVRDAEAGWPDFAPGIQRRVLWQGLGQAAMLYYAQPGACVPHHSHGHDEECLMVQGELFLDDLLLQEGDYQLAPAGTGHRLTQTDTGVVIYAHGDLDLQFV